MNQIPTITQVKQALHKLAEQKNRPSYEVCTAKEVKYALENGLEHPLIEELPFLELEPKQADKPLKPMVKTHRVSKTRAAKQKKKLDPKMKEEFLVWLKNYKGSLAELARLAKCSNTIFSHIKTGRRGLSAALYDKVITARMSLEGVTNRDGEG